MRWGRRADRCDQTFLLNLSTWIYAVRQRVEIEEGGERTCTMKARAMARTRSSYPVVHTLRKNFVSGG